MQSLSIFEHKNYRKYLETWIKSRPHNGHGEKAKIANAIRCHGAYFSQILAGKADLSQEQAFELASHLNLTAEERDYFMVLLESERAGTSALKQYYHSKMDSILRSRSQLKGRLQDKRALPKEDQVIYFSQWYYSVIHLMISTLNGFHHLSALEEALSLPKPILRAAINFLEETGLIQKKGNAYESGEVVIHLSTDSKMLQTHHSNWRLQAIRSIEKNHEDELHYSSIVTIHKDDFEKIRKIYIEAIMNSREVVSKSKNESIVGVFTLDWFKLLK